MSSPFQKAFSAKSPLHNHGNKDIQKAKNLSKKDGEDGDFNYENEKVMKLKTRGERKNASHGEKDQDVDQIENERENSQNDASMANYGVKEKKTEAVTDNNKKPLSPSEQKLMHATQSVTNKAILGQEYSGKVGAIISAPKKNGSVNQMRSPLNSYADGGRGEVYLSEVDLIQNAANAVSTSAMDIENESARSKANRQSKRVDRREKRGDKKGEGTIDKATGEYKATNATSKFNEKTGKIRKKAAGNIAEADAKLKAKMEMDKNTLEDTEYFKKYGQKK